MKKCYIIFLCFFTPFLYADESLEMELEDFLETHLMVFNDNRAHSETNEQINEYFLSVFEEYCSGEISNPREKAIEGFLLAYDHVSLQNLEDSPDFHRQSSRLLLCYAGIALCSPDEWGTYFDIAEMSLVGPDGYPLDLKDMKFVSLLLLRLYVDLRNNELVRSSELDRLEEYLFSSESDDLPFGFRKDALVLVNGLINERNRQIEERGYNK